MFFSTFSLTEAMNFQSNVSRHPFSAIFQFQSSDCHTSYAMEIRLLIKRLTLAFSMLMLKGFAM